MKGLIISLLTLVLYVPFTMIVSHIAKPKGHLKIFIATVFVWSPVYFLAYFAVPRNVYFLPEAWLSNVVWLDVTYGYLLFLLNFHSYMDTFFAFNGGFSMSLLLEILKSGDQGIGAEELLNGFVGPDGKDKIYARRIPHLEKMGCIRVDRGTSLCRLTRRGSIIARIDIFLKRLLNLGAGG